VDYDANYVEKIRKSRCGRNVISNPQLYAECTL